MANMENLGFISQDEQTARYYFYYYNYDLPYTVDIIIGFSVILTLYTIFTYCNFYLAISRCKLVLKTPVGIY